MSSHSSSDERLDAIVAAYYESREAGQALSADDLVAQHPELEKEIRQFIRDIEGVADILDVEPRRSLLEDTADMQASATLRIGSVVRYVGDYEILDELGRGGMGVVYRARQRKLKRIVALKMIKFGRGASESEIHRFRAEARAAARLSHPGIVAVHEVGTHEDQHFYTMDFVSGGSLSDLHRDEPVASRHAADLVLQLAGAVQYAHDQGVVHRDLKPANVLLTVGGSPRITDFGLAKRLWIDDDTELPSMTETGQILGTAGYMAPEQAAGMTRLVAAAADVYALGAILYALLTSRAPFVGQSQIDTIQQVLHREPVSPRTLNPSIPRDLETICLKCLEKEPHKRYGTAQLLADDLQRFLENRPVIARPLSTPARAWRWCRRNPIVAGLSAAMVLTLVVASIVSTTFGFIATDQLGKAIQAKNRESIAKEQAEQDRDKAKAATLKAQEKEREALQNLYVSRLYTMAPAWRNGQWGDLHRMLTEWAPPPDQPDYRGWEWFYLEDQVRQRMTVLPGKYRYISWSPDGRYLLALGERSHILDAYTFEVLHNLSSEYGNFGAWSPNSNRVATIHGAKTFIYDLSKPGVWEQIPHIDMTSSVVTWSSDGERLAIAGMVKEKAEAHVWKFGDETPTHRFPLGNRAHLWAIDWHPSDNRLLAQCHSQFSIWNVDTGEKMVEQYAHGNPAWTVAWHPSGDKMLVTGGRLTRIWAEDGREIQRNIPTVENNANEVSACWNPNGDYFAAAGNDANILIYKTDTQQCHAIERIHSFAVQRMSWHVDGRIAVCNLYGQTCVFMPRISSEPIPSDISDPVAYALHTPMSLRESASFPVVPNGSASHVKWSHCGKQMAAYCHDRRIRVWNAKTRQLEKTLIMSLETPAATGGKLAWSSDDSELAVYEQHGNLTIFTLATGKTRFSVKAEDLLEPPNAMLDDPVVDWSAEDRYLVTAGQDRATVIWDSKTGKQLWQTEKGHGAGNSFSPNKRKYLRCLDKYGKGIAEIIDIETFTQFCRIDVGTPYVESCWGPRGDRIAFATIGGITIVDAETGKSLRHIPSSAGTIVSIAWSPDGKRLASGGVDGVITIWDAETFTQLITLHANAAENSKQRGTARWIPTLDWSPDGSCLASGGGKIQFWGSNAIRLNTAEPTSLAEQTAGIGSTTIAQQTAHLETRIAHYVIQRGGTITVAEAEIAQVEQIPSPPFRIQKITLANRRPLGQHLVELMSQLPAGVQLDLRRSQLDDFQLQLLKQLTSIGTLQAQASSLDDKAVEVLAQLEQLQQLDVTDTSITSAGLEQLKAALPKTEVVWQDRAVEIALARRLLAKNAKLKIRWGIHELDNVTSETSLPSSPFRVLRITAEPKETLSLADFEGLETLEELEAIELLFTRLEDSVLAKLSKLTKLQYIGCGASNMLGRPLADFVTMPHLRGISFGGPFETESLQHFSKFPNLQYAYLGWTKINDQGLESLPTLSKLVQLNLDRTQVTGPGLATLARFESLQTILLSGAPLSDEGLKHLPPLETLQTLNLSQTPITDVSIGHLSNFKNLERLTLLETKISASALAELQVALPNCNIEHSPISNDP